MIKKPEARFGIVNRAQNTIFGYQAWGSVCRDETGTLYAADSAFRTSHVCPFGKTALYLSRNEGRTWTPPMVVNDTYLDDRDAGIVSMGGGRLLLSWFTHSAELYLNGRYADIRRRAGTMETGAVLGMLSMYPLLPPEQAQGGSYVRISEDSGVTWSEPVQLPISAPHGPCVCADGTLVYLGKEMYAGNVPGEDLPRGVIAAYASQDGGYTWQRRGILEKPDGFSWGNFHEPHVLERPDGTLLGVIRAQGEGIREKMTLCTTVSRDGGRTWSEFQWLGVSGAPGHLLRHSSGAVICAFGRREAPFGIRALVSRDGGETWPDEYVLDDTAPDGDLGYPCSAELADGSILTVYYRKYADDKKTSLVYTVWSL